ncbi:hypothetical protein [Acidovorax sp.]|uniref:hypothetical protein n=1 Tax=Acidovorax sp. TaxID=1872122 RepID=UPI00391EE728
MFTPYEPPIEPLTGVWKEDKAKVIRLAEMPTKASRFLQHAHTVETLYNKGAPEALTSKGFPQRKGLSREVHGELYPLARFAGLHYQGSDDVWISWKNGNQSYDATVEDLRPGPQISSPYLEVTTLQDEEDAERIKELNVAGEVGFFSHELPEVADHRRRVRNLRGVLEKKSKIEYEPGTSLLVYTDEYRFRSSVWGGPSPRIDQPYDFGEVLEDLKQALVGFDAVFVFSKRAIYCRLSGGLVVLYDGD